MQKLSVSTAILSAVLAGSSAAALAQSASSGSLAGPRLELAQAYYLVTPGTYDTPVAQAADRKDPTVAGLLSWFIPGLGSFYAGNSGHGIRHVVIHIVAFGVLVGGLASTADAAAGGSFNVDEGRDTGLILGGAGVMLLNGIWSIITAVGDANAHNRGAGGARPGRVVGSLYLDPAVRALSSQGLRAGGVQHPANTGIQLLSVGF